MECATLRADGLDVTIGRGGDGALVVQIDTEPTTDDHETIRVYLNDAALECVVVNAFDPLGRHKQSAP